MKERMKREKKKESYAPASSPSFPPRVLGEGDFITPLGLGKTEGGLWGEEGRGRGSRAHHRR